MVKETQIVNCENFSNWRRLLTVTAYVLRFVQILKARCQKSLEPRSQGTQALDPSELKEAETSWAKDAQRLLHTRFKCGEFKALSPFVENDLIRVGGRAKSDLISYHVDAQSYCHRNSMCQCSSLNTTMTGDIMTLPVQLQK